MRLIKDSGTSKKNLLNYSFFLIQFLTVIALISAGKTDYVKDVALTVIAAALYIFIESKYGISVSNYMRSCLLILITAHNFAGKYLELYLSSTVFDKILHVFGTYSAVLIFFSIMNQLMEISFKAKINKIIFLVLLGLSLGAVFEMLEFAVDVLINPRIPNQAGLADTNLDLVSDLLGALAAAFHLSLKNLQLQPPGVR
ncbi:hypothetical protein ACOBQJ_06660 [Pelotomaculum propionicicum]|uniref:hypothetical protein n=1 Tax=Pelotomaculum propionicicum TaxID=258475 RepID=UPI003B8272CD